jgi:hypothetical protein
MIAIDKVRTALQATPLRQGTWVTASYSGEPTLMCAGSALIVYAGVQPSLIYELVSSPIDFWECIAKPILHLHYGIPGGVADRIPSTFDAASGPAAGIEDVVALCERANEESRAVTARITETMRSVSEAVFTGGAVGTCGCSACRAMREMEKLKAALPQPTASAVRVKKEKKIRYSPASSYTPLSFDGADVTL